MSYLTNQPSTTTVVTPISVSTGTGTVTTSVSPVISNISSTWWNMNTTSSTPFTINTTNNAALVIQGGLTFHYDGRIEYTGKPSEASNAFLKSCAAHIDLKAAGEQALAKTYRRAIERCLRQAKSMSHEDFIAMLENEIETRTAKAAWMCLSEDDSNA